MKESCVECRHHDVFWGGAGCNLLNNGERCKFEPLQEPAEGRRMNKKAVLISIRPKWCEMIASGAKAVEIRKTRPKLKTPFKVYIYCTKSDDMFWVLNTISRRVYGFSALCANLKDAEGAYKGNGKVIGEFVCDTFVTDKTFGHDPLFNGAACMDEVECAAYSCCTPLYGWHISNLEVYDTPKELSEFSRLRQTKFGLEPVSFTRAPQSWCYVEELEGDDHAQE